jgi:hypothetical protein
MIENNPTKVTSAFAILFEEERSAWEIAPKGRAMAKQQK